MQQPSGIDTDPRDHVITQGQMYPRGYNQPAIFGQDNRVDPRPLYSPYTVLGAGTNPQLTSSKNVNPGRIQYPLGVPQQQIMGMSSNYSPYMVPGTGINPQLSNSMGSYPGWYPSGMPQQQIMGMSSNTSRGRMVPTNRGAPYIGPADNTSSRSVSFQSSSISNPNNVSLYGHSTNPAAVSVHHSPPSSPIFIPHVSFTTYCTVIVVTCCSYSGNTFDKFDERYPSLIILPISVKLYIHIYIQS